LAGSEQARAICPGSEQSVTAKAPKAEDRRVQRTRRALSEALIGLILERGWDAVSVQHVCDRANIGRSTFYTHFADKEELLIGGLDDLRRGLRQMASMDAAERPLGFVRGLIEHAEEQRRLFRAVIGKRSGHVIQQRFRQMLIDLVHEDMAQTIAAGPPLDAAARYVAGALMELLIWWLDTRNQFQAADLEKLFLQLTMPVLATLRRRT
jgi:AcrR family transcriptional regulator